MVAVRCHKSVCEVRDIVDLGAKSAFTVGQVTSVVLQQLSDVHMVDRLLPSDTSTQVSVFITTLYQLWLSRCAATLCVPLRLLLISLTPTLPSIYLRCTSVLLLRALLRYHRNSKAVQAMNSWVGGAQVIAVISRKLHK
eukprot:GHVU01151715.1.p1 GENE.GHVU01151715.1~~GHVU01151715.1.p1  ORF type:complete len:139 (+),score=0.27 GHVU01151715.1:336-752(+)